MALPFVKMHGLGNDFLVVDRRSVHAPVPVADVVALCDRHLGVGGDGVLSILDSPRAPLAMHVTNNDGSIAEMCGNGLRCVVRYAVDAGLLPPSGGPVDTGRGVLDCRVEANGEVTVDMGAPLLEPERVPVKLPGSRAIAVPVDVGGTRLTLSAVSMGNPHAIVFLDAGEVPMEAALRWGPTLERHELFPHRTNAEFARMRSATEIDLVVWERGAGLTQACGTGACATVVAAVLTGRSQAGERVRVALPGGVLTVRVEPDFSRVWMTGPAVEVFRGAATLGGDG